MLFRSLPGLYSKDILRKLGEANSIDEVLKIHEDVAESFSMLGSKLPTYGMYSALKRLVKVGGDKISLSALLSGDQAFERNLLGSFEDGKYTNAPLDPNYIFRGNASSRWRSIFSRWVLTRLTKAPMYFDKVAAKMENYSFKPGDTNALGAIADGLRLALIPETTIKGVVDILARTDNPQDWVDIDRKSTRLNSSHTDISRMPSSA